MRAERDPGHHAGGHPSPRPSARFGSGCGRAPVAPLPPPRRTPSRNASPSNSRPFGNTRSRPPLEHHQCVKVGVSQVRKSWCLLTRDSAPIRKHRWRINPGRRQTPFQLRPGFTRKYRCQLSGFRVDHSAAIAGAPRQQFFVPTARFQPARQARPSTAAGGVFAGGSASSLC